MNKPDPVISRKLIDAHIRTVIEQGFSPGMEAICERAGMSKAVACAHFPTRTSLSVAALERVGGEIRRNLNQALNPPNNGRPLFDCDTNRVVECLARQVTDRDNPAGFITICLLGHPAPSSKIRAAAMKEHAAVVGWLENHFRTSHIMPRPHKAANALMALVHGTYANVLGSGLEAWRSIVETGPLMTDVIIACMKEKTAVPNFPARKRRRARRSRKQGAPPDP